MPTRGEVRQLTGLTADPWKESVPAHRHYVIVRPVSGIGTGIGISADLGLKIQAVQGVGRVVLCSLHPLQLRLSSKHSDIGTNRRHHRRHRIQQMGLLNQCLLDSMDKPVDACLWIINRTTFGEVD